MGKKTNNPDLDLKQIEFSKLKGDSAGVAVSDLFLDVKRNDHWKVKMISGWESDLDKMESVTAWITMVQLEDLRTDRPIRNCLKERWNNVDAIIEKILIVIQDNLNVWEPEEEQPEKEPEGLPLEYIHVELDCILKAENQLEALKPHLDKVLPGEGENKQSIFVLDMGSKYPDPTMKQFILVKGTEGGGKSTVMRETSDPFKVKDVGRFTAHALDYTNLEGYEILRLKEIGVMDQENQGVSTIKFLSSDDRGYTVEVTVRDKETGELGTKSYKIPPITVNSSTTRVELDPQFQRRCWIFNVDESPEQTKKVLEWKANLENQKADVALERRPYTDYEFSRAVLKTFTEQFEPCKVIIPFLKALSEILSQNVLRIRGDFDKVVTFIKLYGAFNKKRLLKWPKGNVYFVTPAICVEALKLVEKPLLSMMSNLEDRARALMATMKELEFDKKGSTIGKAEREKIAVRLGRSERTVRSYLSQWESAGYMGGDQKKPKTFILLYNLEEIETKVAGILEKLKSADNLMEELTKEGMEWLRTRLEIVSPEMALCFSSKTMPQNIPDMLKTEKESMSSGKPISHPELGTYTGSIDEAAEENRQINKPQGNLSKPASPTIQEVLESTRVRLGSVFQEEKMLAEIVQLGFTREEAQKRVDHFKQKEIIVKDDIGGWHFV